MKIVFMVRNFVPNPNAVGICADKIIKSIREHNNIQLYVICEKNGFNQKEFEIIENVKIYRFLTAETRVRMHLTDNNNLNSIWKRIQNKSSSIAIRAFYFFKDINGSITAKKDLVKHYLSFLEKINPQKDDIIVPFSAPFESVIAAIKYKEMNPTVSLVPILYDLYSDCPYINKNKIIKRIKYKNNKDVERQMSKLSTRILCHRYWLDSLSGFDCKDKTYTLEVPFLEKKEIFESKNNELVYCGNFQRRIRKTDYLFDVLDYYLSTTNDNIIFRFIGNGFLDKNLIKLKKKYPCRIKLDGILSHSKAIEIMNNSKGLIVVANERNNQTPSKVFECMSLRKPIIYFTKATEKDMVDVYLEKYKQSFVFRKGRKLSEQCSSFSKFLRCDLPKIDYSELQNIFIKATPDYTAKLILSSKGLF